MHRLARRIWRLHFIHSKRRGWRGKLCIRNRFGFSRRIYSINFYRMKLLPFPATFCQQWYSVNLSLFCNDGFSLFQLLTVNPAENSLALVYRDKNTLKFVKHINNRINEMQNDKEFFDIALTYFEWFNRKLIALRFQQHLNLASGCRNWILERNRTNVVKHFDAKWIFMWNNEYT